VPNSNSLLTALGRAGYAAKGVVYVIMGLVAAQAILGRGQQSTDAEGAMRIIGNGPIGVVALVLIAIGLFGYMAWRLVAAVTDAENKGDKPTGLAVRIGQAGRGLLYGALGVHAVQLLRSGTGSDGNTAQDWSARLLQLPYGSWIVGAVAAGVFGYAVYQMYRAASEERVRKHLNLRSASPAERTWVVRLGRFGTAARAIVFAIIAWLLLRAARESDPSEAGGIEESLRVLAGTGNGRWVLGTIGLGLVAYGVYQLATARYREMRA
jgi:hypothetical protein